MAICLFFIGFGLRIAGFTVSGHVVYAIDIILWIVRLLDIFSVNKYLGPYVVMIGRMVCCYSGCDIIVIKFTAKEIDLSIFADL